MLAMGITTHAARAPLIRGLRTREIPSVVSVEPMAWGNSGLPDNETVVGATVAAEVSSTTGLPGPTAQWGAES
jgi:hypothetical protein